MDTVSAEVVEKVWTKMASLTLSGCQKLSQRMSQEQPLILAYLMAVDHDILNRDERELLVYLGMTVWQMMSQGPQRLRQVTEKVLNKAEAANIKMDEYLEGETGEGFLSTTRTILDNYQQPEVLRYVVEALMEEPEEGCIIRDVNRGALFLDLKTVIDCFDRN